jgi:tetratricopeptide (TPR) repeat protein
VSLLAAAVALTDLCGAAPGPAAPPDPADSAAYATVGDEALATGDSRTAAIAYRNAVALDPTNTHAKAALAALCDAQPASEDDTALLDAIARYRAGERTAAGAAFAAIVAAGTRTAAAAHFFLGLIALDRHEAGVAIRELGLARSDPEYRELARPLLRLARRDGALAITLVVEPELDSNPQLLPDTPPAGAVTGTPQVDEDLLVAATITARPWPWLAIRDVLVWRNQRQFSALDFVGENAQVAAELARGRARAMLRYDLEYDLLDGSRYLFANRAGVAVRHDGSRAAIVASYAVRRRDFARASEQAFSGWVHAMDAGAVVHLPRGLELDARLAGGRELTADRSYANVSGSVQLALRTRSTSTIRLAVSASGGYARYDRAEPDGQLRRDVPVEASADLEIDLGDHVIAVAGASATRNMSSIEDFRYAKLVARCGLVLAFGAL